MLQAWVIVGISFIYLAALFAIAYFGDRRAAMGRSLISNPYVYALSLAIYCTSWTYFGNVGRAARIGIEFLAVYLGPTLMFALGWLVLRKIMRISKLYRVTSIADFVASRYGKSTLLGGVATVLITFGTMPYIAIQLKAVSSSFAAVLQDPLIGAPLLGDPNLLFNDNAFYVTLTLIPFAILFGARHLDATERHEGMVLAIAFESLVKLAAFLAVGIFVTFGMFRGFDDLFARAAASPDLAPLLTIQPPDGHPGDWTWMLVLSMVAVVLLPHQFQTTVVENVDEQHLDTAMWLFPLYLLLTNLFVLPIALAGLLRFPGGSVHPDTFILMLPLAEQQGWLTLLAFIGGLSAATGMMIVVTIALSTMVSNDLVMPVLLHSHRLRLNERADLSGVLLAIRRSAIVLLLLLGYAYFRIADIRDLISTGLVSFVAVAQFGPAVIGGLFWKRGTRTGVLAGLVGGFLIWTHTLLLPTVAQPNWWVIPESMTHGPFGIAWLRPYALFGLSGLDPIAHSMFWSLLFNLVCYIGISLITRQSLDEQRQAALFVDVFRLSGDTGSRLWRGTAAVGKLRTLLARFLGPARADETLAAYAQRRGISVEQLNDSDAELVYYAETQLAGAIGTASARVVVASAVDVQPPGLDEVMLMLDEASQVMAYSRRLEQQSRELAAATAELRSANERLRELDRLKDEFISAVTHELRTPLTSIRAFSEILFDGPNLPVEQRSRFLGIIIKESERLTRIINQVLDLSKIESGSATWHVAELNLKDVIEASIDATSQLFLDKQVQLEIHLPDHAPPIIADQDRVIQVMLNLLSNAVKFCDAERGWVRVSLRAEPAALRVDVSDNGPGISPADQAVIFEKFRQVSSVRTGKPEGTGLGLTISREIITRLGGELWVDSTPGAGATFSFRLPLAVQPALDGPAAPPVARSV